MTLPLLLPLLLAPATLVGDWPCYRGPDHDGVSRETDWADRGRAAWTAEVGLGHSSPSVAGGRLYTLGFDAQAERDVLWCLDADTGEELWTLAYPGKLRDQDHTGGTLTTPAVAGGRVYVTSREGEVRCVDAETGELEWRRDLTADLGVDPGIYGFSGSPLLAGGRLVVGFDAVVALDPATGETQWVAGELENRFSTPTPFRHGGRDLLAVFSEAELCLVDPTDGRRLSGYPWRPQPRGLNASSPVVVGERVFVSSAYERGCALLELEGQETRAAWQNRSMRNKMAGCVLVADRIVGFDESMLKALDLEGREVWRKRGLGTGAVSAAGDRLILTSSRGELVVADPTGADFRELSRERVIERGTFWTPPVLADGRIYVRSGLGTLVCRDHRASGADEARGAGGAATLELPAAGELFARHLAAIGGAEAVRRHASRTQRGTFAMRSVGFPPVPVEVRRAAPDLWRARIKLPGGREGWLTRVYDGEEGYELNPYLGDKLFPADVTREHADSESLFADALADELYRSRETVARVEFDDRPCWKVACVTASGAERSVYFDVATGLLAGREGPTESIVVYGDWQAHDGLLLPMLERHFVQDTGIEETWRFDEVDFEPLDPALWERPEAIDRLLAERDAGAAGNGAGGATGAR